VTGTELFRLLSENGSINVAIINCYVQYFITAFSTSCLFINIELLYFYAFHRTEAVSGAVMFAFFDLFVPPQRIFFL